MEIYWIAVRTIIYQIILKILNYLIALNSDHKINHKFWIYKITLRMQNYQNALKNINYQITLNLKLPHYPNLELPNYPPSSEITK